MQQTLVVSNFYREKQTTSMENQAEKKVKHEDTALPEGNDKVKKARIDSGEEQKLEDVVQPKINDNLVGVTFEVVTNNNSDEACMRLVDLKNIFSRQLPKMPKEYIVRLVFDHRHISVAMIRHGRTIGGICYRPYPEQRFGEIAFCAISGNEQLKGYGSILMNQLKRHVQKDKIEYFLTYADNYAIGYFQRQGFSKSISMPKERWFGYIKDYDGGTLMECYVHPAVDYLSVRSLVAKQRAFIMQRIKERSEADTVYSGLELFQQGRRVQSLMDVPGVAEAGWTPFHLYKGSTERDRNLNLTKLQGVLKGLLDKVRSSIHATQFTRSASLSASASRGNLAATNTPSTDEDEGVDLAVVTLRLRMGDYYRTKDMMRADLLRMVNAAQRKYPPGSEEAQSAEGLRRVIEETFSDGAAGGGGPGAAGAGGSAA